MASFKSGHFTTGIGEWGREFVIPLYSLVGESSNWPGCGCGGKEKDPYPGRKHTRHI